MHNLPIVTIKKPDTSTDIYDDLLSRFEDKQYCSGGVDGLQKLEAAPAHVVIIEADTEDLSGLEIAEAIREIDDESKHFSYIILIGDNSDEDLNESCIDAHIPFVKIDKLSLMVAIGCRLSHQINSLQALNSDLNTSNKILQKGQLLDPLTGLGNRRYAEQSLRDAIRQIESRGGAVCFLLVSVHNYQETIDQYDEKIADELIVSVSEKIQHLVRPMDIVTYYGPGEFALVLLQPTIEHCTADCYKRIFDGVRLKRYQTAAGFLPANIAMSLCASHADNGPPNPQLLIESAQKNSETAFQSDTIFVHHLTP
ncbi:MAG: diguanylate cyclase (GGDEF)-like protein [Flavobacterium sp.]|jgi:diguanylate cyclase (GGDEF)-like protein